MLVKPRALVVAPLFLLFIGGVCIHHHANAFTTNSIIPEVLSHRLPVLLGGPAAAYPRRPRLSLSLIIGGSTTRTTTSRSSRLQSSTVSRPDTETVTSSSTLATDFSASMSSSSSSPTTTIMAEKPSRYCNPSMGHLHYYYVQSLNQALAALAVIMEQCQCRTRLMNILEKCCGTSRLYQIPVLIDRKLVVYLCSNSPHYSVWTLWDGEGLEKHLTFQHVKLLLCSSRVLPLQLSWMPMCLPQRFDTLSSQYSDQA